MLRLRPPKHQEHTRMHIRIHTYTRTHTYTLQAYLNIGIHAACTVYDLTNITHTRIHTRIQTHIHTQILNTFQNIGIPEKFMHDPYILRLRPHKYLTNTHTYNQTYTHTD